MHKNSNFGVLVKKKRKHRGIDVWDEGSSTVVKAWLSAEAAIIEAFFCDQHNILGTVLQSQT